MDSIIPTSTTILFVCTTLLCVMLFLRAISLSKTHSKLVLPIGIGLMVWMSIQMLASLNGFYIINPVGFPWITLGIVPAIFTIALLFIMPCGRDFVDSLPLKPLTWIHIVRIPVEVTLYMLFLAKLVPELMTFAGRNFDIIAGITAPIVIALVNWKEARKRSTLLLTWNIVMLGFLLFIVVNALLSAPLSFQQFGFDQPNIAIAYFPMIWLPGVVVPIVILSHLTAIRRLVLLR